jgi:hypothetical protein
MTKIHDGLLARSEHCARLRLVIKARLPGSADISRCSKALPAPTERNRVESTPD